MAGITRGFIGRRRERDPRLPPGQYDARDDWPVLHAEATPSIPTDRWTFTIEGLVENTVTWNWEEIHALPRSRYEGDIHCVTTWSKLGMSFDGVSVDTLLAAARPLPTAAQVLVPHLYFWKSAKWVSGLRLLDHDEQGFWERNGYHDRGDPWKEQRYQGD